MMTHTYATAMLDISAAAYNEIRAALLKAGYHNLMEDRRGRESIDMEGISIRAVAEELAEIPAVQHSRTVTVFYRARNDGGVWVTSLSAISAIYVGDTLFDVDLLDQDSSNDLVWTMVRNLGARLVTKFVRDDWMSWRERMFAEAFPLNLSDVHPDAFIP